MRTVAAAIPHGCLSQGITSKFIPKYPETTVNGRPIIASAVRRFMTAFMRFEAWDR